MREFSRAALRAVGLLGVLFVAATTAEGQLFDELRGVDLAEEVLRPADEKVSTLHREVAAGVVRLGFTAGDKTWFGAGFFIGTRGVIVTNYHLVEAAGDGRAYFGDTSRAVEGVLACDPKQDLALIKIDPEGLSFKPLRLAAEAPPAGADVVAIGNPLGFADAMGEGVVTGVRSGDQMKETLPGLRDAPMTDPATRWLLTTAPTSPGNSGGPLVQPDGQVVGVLTWWRAAGRKVSCAAGVEELRRLIGAANLQAVPLKEVAAREKAAQPSDNVPVADEFETGWLPDSRFKRNEVAEAVGRATKALKCHRCGGEGRVTVLRTESYHDGMFVRKREVKESQTCADCRGRGSLWTDATGEALASLAERVLLMDRRTVRDADYERAMVPVRDLFRSAAIDSRIAAARCNASMADVLAGPQERRGRPVTFYAALYRRLPYGDATLCVMRAWGSRKPILVRARQRPGAAEGSYCLVGGVCAGLVTVRTADGVVREMGVEAVAVEPVR